MRIMKCAFFLIINLTFQLNVAAQHGVMDTTFLLRENKYGNNHIIFIDNNKTSKYYEYISTFKFDATDIENYQSSLDIIEGQNPKLFTKHTIADFPRQWCSLYIYKKNYYLYAPSNYLFNYRIAISDTTYMDNFEDRMTASLINSFIKADSKTYKFNLDSYDQSNRIIVIHIIDEENGIAIFEDTAAELNHEYTLMVRADRIKNFPIIINSADMQMVEYKFDKPNFEKLLK